MYNFIIIDDNRIDLLIAQKAVASSDIETGKVFEFGSAVQALEFIRSYEVPVHTIVLIDIQMPVMNGFAFMDEFEKLPDEQRARFTCMYLTSSSNDLDRLRAEKYKDIRSFISKPISSARISQILKTLNL